jgi:hypothetical protein
MVMAPASTGNERRRRIAVISTDQTNSGMESNLIEEERMFITVVIKLMAPRIEEAPAKCRLKMAKSIENPEWKRFPARGGYTVHPVPAPFPAKAEAERRVREGGRSQNLMLFIRGNAMSCAPIISGTSQFPNPPIMTGITIKKIITKACAVTIVL